MKVGNVLAMIDFTGDLEMHIKYDGRWLLKAGKKNVKSAHLLKAIEELSLMIQRAIDKSAQGETEKNVIQDWNYPEEEGVKD